MPSRLSFNAITHTDSGTTLNHTAHAPCIDGSGATDDHGGFTHDSLGTRPTTGTPASNSQQGSSMQVVVFHGLPFNS
ncbi:hypothetical protein [Acidovorax sp. ST3]|uniref:hypothetical protein n=1 Tax=Acidovorax sp. ST3 TaxID=2219062 RepID=UPI001EEFED12|nr:hypothetical protein [Acidovorax sp. ST3]